MNVSLELINTVAGVFGSVAAMGLTYPLLTITTRQQVKKKEESFLNVLLEIIQKEGWEQLYSGLNTSLIANAASMGIYFYTYEKLKNDIVLRNNRNSLTTLENLVVGYIAGAVNMTLTTPFWTISTRLQAKKENLLSVVASIWKESQIAGFFKGWVASMVLCINPAIQWMVYEQLSIVLKKIKKTDNLTGLQIFILGAISKIVATLITYPYIVIKSRMQVSLANQKDGGNRLGAKDEEQYQYKSITHAFVEIVKTEGFTGLYKGLNSKIFQSVLNSAFMFYFKEKFVTWTFTLLIFVFTQRKKWLRARKQ